MMPDGQAPPPAALRLTSSSVDGITVTAVDGLLDATTREQFADHLSHASPSLILDLGEVTFMDSRALGLIVHHWKASCAAGGKFALVGVEYSRLQVMWITGLVQILPLYGTLDEALASLA
ncbi:STAS domain-containing protein [Nonomuraea rosea]